MTSGVGSSGSSTSNSVNSTVSSGQASLNTDYNSFLQLLTTQLKNQDPLSPMDTNTFTQQLVEMNGVQQQLQTNSLLQQLVNQSSGAGPAVDLIGKQVQAASPTVTMNNGTADWTYELDGKAASATLNVTDSTGKVVWSQPAPDLSQGKHDFTWNGKTTSGGQATTGTYTLSVVANDSNLQTVNSSVYVSGVVTGVQSGSSGTMLNLGSTTVNYANITSVTNASSSGSGSSN
ncbi:MAG: flagellar hook assembly protein FlgD [Mycobacterium sp.]|nr:flagellar hook assembly protein FlgD [Mycobacterium sp.]